tara:strand:- start:222 stop:1196 length:975 start_codon:yes stop_codon:yes gene_type:complete
MKQSNHLQKIKGNARIRTIEEDATLGLLSQPRSIPPKYFYDARGSNLFEKICETKEYYPTRKEDEILAQYSSPIMDQVRPANLLEIGSGSSLKTERLLQACDTLGCFPIYSAFDISGNALLAAKTRLSNKFPWLEMSLLLGDYEAGFTHLPRVDGINLVLFLGSTIGNLSHSSALIQLHGLHKYMSSSDYLLLGYDRVKDEKILNAAYNDQQGLTAAFNLNMLQVLNHRLEGNFAVDEFEHSALYDSDRQQIEMRLIAKSNQRIKLQKLPANFEMQREEIIQTEISRKFTIEKMDSLLSQANFDVVQTFSSKDDYFSLALAICA